MLVLSRKVNEKIIIGDDVAVMLVEIRGDKVRLGIEAPPEVPVHRLEVFEAIKRAAGFPPDAKPKPSYVEMYRATLAEIEMMLAGDFHNNRDPVLVPGIMRAIELVAEQRRRFEPIGSIKREHAGRVAPLKEGSEQNGSCGKLQGSIPPVPLDSTEADQWQA